MLNKHQHTYVFITFGLFHAKSAKNLDPSDLHEIWHKYVEILSHKTWAHFINNPLRYDRKSFIDIFLLMYV